MPPPAPPRSARMRVVLLAAAALGAATLSHAQAPSPFSSTTGSPRPWPAKAEVDSRTIEVETAPPPAEGQPHVYRSANFEFVADEKLAGSVLKEIARTFEATRALLHALPWGLEPHPPGASDRYRARFYSRYEDYLREGGPPNTSGYYSSSDRLFRVPFASLGLELRGKTWFKHQEYENDTLVHEITHQLLHDYLPFLPGWVIEGTAEYTEMLPYAGGRFLSGSHQRAIKQYVEEAGRRGVRPATLGKLADHLRATRGDWAEAMALGGTTQFQRYFAACLLVYYFSHLDGDGRGTRFLAYLGRIRDARNDWGAFFRDPRITWNPDGSFTYPSDFALPAQSLDETFGLEQLALLLDGRDPDQLQKDIVAAFRKIGVRW